MSRFILASLVFHRNFLFQNVKENSPIFSNPFFSQLETNEIERLNGLILGPFENEDLMEPTGIPPHIAILASFKVTLTKVLKSNLKEKKKMSLNDVHRLLQAHFIKVKEILASKCFKFEF